MVLLIFDMNLLNLYLQSSGVSNFALMYICMSTASFLIRICYVHLTFLSTPQDKIMGEIVKDEFIKIQRT